MYSVKLASCWKYYLINAGDSNSGRIEAPVPGPTFSRPLLACFSLERWLIFSIATYLNHFNQTIGSIMPSYNRYDMINSSTLKKALRAKTRARSGSASLTPSIPVSRWEMFTWETNRQCLLFTSSESVLSTRLQMRDTYSLDLVQICHGAACLLW